MPNLAGWSAAFGVLFVWSGWVVVSRLGVINTLTVHDMAALRFAVASLAVAPLVWRFWPRQLAWWKIGLLGCGPGVPYVLFAFTGMQYAPASHAGILINGTLPIFVAVVAWAWLRERATSWQAAGMAVILGGCLMIGWDRATAGAGETAWIGHLLFLGSAATLGAYMVATRAWGITAMQALVAVPIANLVWFGPLYLFFLPKAIDRAGWDEILLQGLYQGLGPSLLGVVLFTAALRAIGSMRTAAVMAGVPAVAALLAIPVLGEWPSPQAWLGLALTTGGILLTAGWRPGFGRKARGAA